MSLLKSFYIKNKKISEISPSYIIAEIGVNHEGSKTNCKKLIKKAHECGADAVKLQIANPEESYSRDHSSYKVFKNKYLSDKTLSYLISYAESLNLALFATPGDLLA